MNTQLLDGYSTFKMLDVRTVRFVLVPEVSRVRFLHCVLTSYRTVTSPVASL